jgi:hypothetical protein
VKKNDRLISKIDAVREQFNLTKECLDEKQSESVTKWERKKKLLRVQIHLKIQSRGGLMKTLLKIAKNPPILVFHLTSQK